MRFRDLTAGLAGALLLSSFALAGACSSDDEEDKGSGGTGGRPENTGSACETPADCYPDVDLDGAALAGEVQCLDRVDDGYCTHLCQDDADCCSVEGECPNGLAQVCSPFESTGLMMCFLSCEPADVTPPDGGTVADENEYCQRYASSDFICRSSGGGSANRKICVPGDCDVGEDCTEDAQCATGLTCVKDFNGGYCTVRDCTLNADCPANSVCINQGGMAFCSKTCATDSDCSFCRAYDVRGTCSSNVTFVEAGTTGSACVPP